MSQAPTNISAFFADISSIAVSFSDPSSTSFNSAQTYYYLASVVDVSGLKTSYATGSKSPIYIMGLSAGTSYYCTVSTVQTASSDSVSVTTLSYPTITDISFSGGSNGVNSVSWSGSDISYVKITRQIGTLGYVDISLVDIASPYNDTDISGNTVYSYYHVTPYMKKYGPLTTGSASAVSGRSAVFNVTDLSAIFYDTSAIKISFTPSAKNNFTGVYYTLSATDNTYGYITSVSGSSSPLLVQNLSKGTSYTCYIMTTLDSLYTVTSSSLSVTTFTPYSVYAISGGSNFSIITTSPTFNTMLQLLYSSSSYSITFNKTTTAQVLLVAGGGGGILTNHSWVCGGGGGGGEGVGYGTILFMANTPYTITVGNGGAAYSKGSNTTISGSSGTMLVSETAYGGGNCQGYDSYGNAGGSSGAGMISGGGLISNNAAATKGLSSSYSGLSSITYAGFQGNVGSFNQSAGGGGAGGTGYVSTSSTNAYGGIGYYYSYTNSYYGGGGCGGSSFGATGYTTALAGGGGNGQGSRGNSNNATPNTGGGAGGSYSAGLGSGFSGGTGGSGIAILLFN